MPELCQSVAALVVVGPLSKVTAVQVGDRETTDDRREGGGEHLRTIAQDTDKIDGGLGQGV